ncbi:DUF6146 family protein [Flavobacterium seoulense]|uniref:Lipoprotein n=1 Tax=Flavobacterium seoulense TaxID=1492738 RepID=A0A066WUK5_9FLAO|nr:DUF6146 family protein [Flavobacterium seoulense]KDN56253.1 hypothetical protein FEM21_08050 [Flavobacterium seoulense]
MKNSIYTIALIFGLIILSCTTTKTNITKQKNTIASVSDTIKIVNEEVEYEVIIIDPGFATWLNSMAQPRGFYTQSYLETKNQIYINEWNNRFMQPQRYNRNLYEMSIDYDSNIDYGYEVNYLIYNYMIYFQNNYNQRLFGRVPLR